jgi:hypothetical protein
LILLKILCHLTHQRFSLGLHYSCCLGSHQTFAATRSWRFRSTLPSTKHKL